MFTVEKKGLSKVIEMLCNYQVTVKIGKHYITVAEIPDYEEDYHLCEMAFQCNLKQVGNVCAACCEEKKDLCGHTHFSM